MKTRSIKKTTLPLESMKIFLLLISFILMTIYSYSQVKPISPGDYDEMISIIDKYALTPGKQNIGGYQVDSIKMKKGFVKKGPCPEPRVCKDSMVTKSCPPPNDKDTSKFLLRIHYISGQRTRVEGKDTLCYNDRFELYEHGNCDEEETAIVAMEKKENELIIDEGTQEEKITEAKSSMIYPNPIHSYEKLFLKDVIPFDNAQLTIVSITGQIVKSQIIDYSALQDGISLSEIPAGSYIVFVNKERYKLLISN